MTYKKVLDWISLFLGIWLLMASWLLGTSSNHVSVYTALILGILILADSIWSLVEFRAEYTEWSRLALGVLLFLAPWALGFYRMSNAAWDAWIVGLIIVVLSAINLPEARKLSHAH